jgi:hypothetical protein
LENPLETGPELEAPFIHDNANERDIEYCFEQEIKTETSMLLESWNSDDFVAVSDCDNISEILPLDESEFFLDPENGEDSSVPDEIAYSSDPLHCPEGP